MSEHEYDLLLAEAAGELPPPPEEQAEPWSRAMKYILWGLALVTFRLELVYLQFILPCVGSVLVFLGFRSLRRSARGFATAYAASIALLIMRALGIAAGAVRPEYFGALGYFTSAAGIVLNFTLLLGLRSGIRTAFSATSGEGPRDLSLWPVAAYAGVIVRHYAAMGYGPGRVRQELQHRGVPRELWDDALARMPDPEEAIDRFLTAKLRGKTPDRATLQRLSAALQRRGFSWQDIRPALARLDREPED